MLGTLALLTLAQFDFAPAAGVPVHCAENLRGKVGRARVEVIVGAGALQEDPKQQGAAHLLEHLLLRPLGYDDNNGETSWDYTSYFSDVEGAEMSKAATDLLRALRSDFTDEAFDIERKVVVRELEERNASRSTLIQVELFEGTPFLRPIGGSVDQVDALTIEDVRRYHREFYVRQNIVVFLRGATDCAAIRTAIEAELSPLPDGRVASLPRAATKPSGRRTLQMGAGSFWGGFYWYDVDPSAEVVMQLVAKHLEQGAFTDLRGARGLTYSPRGRFERMGRGGFVALVVTVPKGEEGTVHQWFADATTELRQSTNPSKHLEKARIEVTKELKQRPVRAALAQLRGEPEPLKILESLSNDDLKRTLQQLTAPEHSFLTPAAGIAGKVIVVVVGLGVLAFILMVGRQFLSS